jgi:hypothetical protein
MIKFSLAPIRPCSPNLCGSGDVMLTVPIGQHDADRAGRAMLSTLCRSGNMILTMPIRQCPLHTKSSHCCIFADRDNLTISIPSQFIFLVKANNHTDQIDSDQLF